MANLLGLDFETYSGVDLPTHGMHRYMADPTFKVLLGGLKWRMGDGVMMSTLRLDFVMEYANSLQQLKERLQWCDAVVAHNISFERGVLLRLGINVSQIKFIDSAVVARAAGAAGKLEACGPQLLGIDKVEQGKHLMRLFSIPTKEAIASGDLDFDLQVVLDHPKEWDEYGYYCEVDAEIGLKIVEDYLPVLTSEELDYQDITQNMNEIGWPIDVPLVEEMQRRYLANQAEAEANFRARVAGAKDLNLNSHKQQVEFCASKGVKANSFDEQHVASLLKRLTAKLQTMEPSAARWSDYNDVVSFLLTKQILGGAALKKLQTMLDTVTTDSGDPRLKDQYLHIGAGQTWRTTGRSVQMQNLKRLDSDNLGVMEELEDPDTEWDNGKLAQNMRQVFTASDTRGALIVGDFSSVESRGLAWASGDERKLQAFREGKDMYKFLASTPEMYGVPYDQVTKAQRQTGKVGELSCGYGAGGPAVHAFAAKMGVDMTPTEAADLVTSWRGANPDEVAFWAALDAMLHAVVERGSIERKLLPDGFVLELARIDTPASLLMQHRGAQSIRMSVYDPRGRVFMNRYFHGCYMRGRNIGYYKPSELKSGDLWKNHYRDQKTKEIVFYQVYGGKLTGIFVQSFCRQLFFQSLKKVHAWTSRTSRLDLIGQFHDEMVLDWAPGGVFTLPAAKHELGRFMSDPGMAVSFPLEADIKHDYRYTK